MGAIALTLRNCQEMMRDFILRNVRCNIWASPGTGKTGACFTVIDLLKLLGSNFFPVLVIGPKEVCVSVWPREQKKWTTFRDLRVVTLAGRDDEFDRIEQMRRPADIYVINYELVPWLVDFFAKRKLPWPFKTVIADEATKLRNFRLRNGGVRARALALVAKYVGRWINLTGTPSPDGKLLDLWGQMWFIDRGQRLGRTFGDFKRMYFDENEYSHEIVLKPGAFEIICEKIRDVTLSLQAADYFDLLPVERNDIHVQLNDDAMRKYIAMESTLFADLGPGVEAANAAVMSGKCLQMASGAIYTGDGSGSYIEIDDSKLVALDNLLEDMSGNPLLCAYHWKFDVDRIKKRFPFARTIDGAEDIDDFNAKRIKLGLIYPGSKGHGIDLAVGGHHLAFYSHWWDLEAYQQVIERLGPTRQAQHGLNRNVFLHSIIAQGTLDEAVIARLTGKKTVQDALIERMKRT